MARRFRPSDQLLPFGPSPALRSRPRRRKYAQLQRRLRLGRIRGYNSLRGYFPLFDHRAAALASQFLRHGEARGMYQASLRSLQRFYWWSRGRRTLRWMIPLRQSHQKTEFLVKALGALFAEERRIGGYRAFLARKAAGLRAAAAEKGTSPPGNAPRRRRQRLPLADPLGPEGPENAGGGLSPGRSRRWHGADALLGLRPLRLLDRRFPSLPVPATGAVEALPCTGGYVAYLRARARAWLRRRRAQLRRRRPRTLPQSPAADATPAAITAAGVSHRRWLRRLSSLGRHWLRRRRRWSFLARALDSLRRRRRWIQGQPRRQRQRLLRRWRRRSALRPWRRRLRRRLRHWRRRSTTAAPAPEAGEIPAPATTGARLHRWARERRSTLALALVHSPASGALGLWKRRRPWAAAATGAGEPLVRSRRRWLALLESLSRRRRLRSFRCHLRRRRRPSLEALFDLSRRRPWRFSRRTPGRLAPALRHPWRSARRRERLERRLGWRLRRAAATTSRPRRRRIRRRRRGLSPRRRSRRRAQLTLRLRRRQLRRRRSQRSLRGLRRWLATGTRTPLARTLAATATAGRRRRSLRSLRRCHRPWRVAYRVTSLRITDPETLEEHSQLLLEKNYRRSSYGHFYGDLLRALRPAQLVIFLVLGHKSSRRLEQRVKFGADEPARERVVLGFLRDQVSRNPAYNYLRRNVEVKPWPKVKKVLREVPRRSRRLTTSFTVRFGEQLGQMLTQSGALRRSLDDYDRHSAEGFSRHLRHYRWLPVRGGLGAALRRGQGLSDPR